MGRVGLVETQIILTDVQPVAGQHLNAKQQEGAAAECLPEVGGALDRRGEGIDDVLEDAAFLNFGGFVLVAGLAWNDDEEQHGGDKHADGGDGEAEAHAFDEICADECADGETQCVAEAYG